MNKSKSEITFKIELDQHKIPEKIHWTASDGGHKNQEAKSVFISVWDDKNQDALFMDLWTKDMPMHEMKIFFYENFLRFADVFERAIADEKMSETIRDFASYFAEKMEIK